MGPDYYERMPVGEPKAFKLPEVPAENHLRFDFHY